MKAIELFTDGSCLGNPGFGGWAYVLTYNSFIKEGYGAVGHTTNNQMEIRAVLEGLRQLKEPCSITLFTDSEYVAKSINMWVEGWKEKNWKGVKNSELWKEFLKLSKDHTINAMWVKGHNGHPQNERCDHLARSAAEQLRQKSQKRKSETD